MSLKEQFEAAKKNHGFQTVDQMMLELDAKGMGDDVRRELTLARVAVEVDKMVTEQPDVEIPDEWKPALEGKGVHYVPLEDLIKFANSYGYQVHIGVYKNEG